MGISNTENDRAAEALKRLALDEHIKAFVLDNPWLFKRLRAAALRFVAGDVRTEALDAARRMNDRGHAATIDFMGESARDAHIVSEAVGEFLELARSLVPADLNSSMSLDLSHLGLLLDSASAIRNCLAIAQVASASKRKVVISMEGYDRVDLVLSAYEQIAREYPQTAITLQAYLWRTESDLTRCQRLSGKIRLVKGAFAAPDGVSLKRGPDLDARYLTLVEQLLKGANPISIATHDAAIIEHCLGFIDRYRPKRNDVEFEMLYGVEPDLLMRLHHRGYRTRVYLTYGKEWFLYLCNRLAEYPENLVRAFTDAMSIDSEVELPCGTT